MSLISGTGTRYDFEGLRESLHDQIYDISPMDVPFMSGAGQGPRAKQTLEEWQTESLDAPDGTNAWPDGDEATFTTPSATVKVGNQTQISRKTVILADNLEVIDKAGRKSEMAKQIAKRGKELKRDMETIFLRAQGGSAGSSGVARTLAALNAWVKTNTNFYTTDGANPTYTAGVPSAARTDGGTLRAFTETIAKDVMQQGWTNGAEFKVLMVGPVNKQRVSTDFDGIVSRNFDLSNVDPRPTAAIASIDVYVGDFDTLRIVPNRFQRERDAWFLDFDYVEVRYLRPIRRVPLAKTGDATKNMLVTEYTLVVKNEAAVGGAFDLTTA